MSSRLFNILNKDYMLSATHEVYLKHLGKGGVDFSNLSIIEWTAFIKLIFK